MDKFIATIDHVADDVKSGIDHIAKLAEGSTGGSSDSNNDPVNKIAALAKDASTVADVAGML